MDSDPNLDYSHQLLGIFHPLPSTRQHPSYGDCPEVKREYYQNSSVLDCVTSLISTTNRFPSAKHYTLTLGIFLILTCKVLYIKLAWYLACDQGSLVCQCMQDYKSLCAAVTIRATLVNIQTDTHTDRI